jgi:hypothetical protein
MARTGSIDGRRPAARAETASLKVGFEQESGVIGSNTPIETGGEGFYEAAHIPSQTIIERGCAICECKIIMQISPVRLMSCAL